MVKHVKMTGVKGFVYRLLRVSPVWREWRGCCRLAEVGCEVVRPLGIVIKRGRVLCWCW